MDIIRNEYKENAVVLMSLLIVLGVIIFVFIALCTPYISSKLLLSLETFRPFDPEKGVGEAGAIVILSADYREYMPEFDGQSVGPLSLQRLRYGAWLHRQTGLPILVAGGKLANAQYSLAGVMRTTLVKEFNVPVRWIEDNSLNTLQHAEQVPPMMSVEGIEEIILVTHGWHMRRAVMSFEHFGQKVIPAPTCLTQPPTPIITDFRPGPRWLVDSYFAIYERLAYIQYRYRYFRKSRKADQVAECDGTPRGIAGERGSKTYVGSRADGEQALGGR